MFDSSGFLQLILSIGHRLNAAERRQLRWTVFVQPSLEDLIESVSFRVESESSGSLEAIISAPGPFELQRTASDAFAFSSITVVIHVVFVPWLQQRPHRHVHEVLLRPPGAVAAGGGSRAAANNGGSGSRVGRGGSGGACVPPVGQSDEVLVTLRDPAFSLRWEPHEAPPGHLLHEEPPSMPSASGAVAWADPGACAWAVADSGGRGGLRSSVWGSDGNLARRVAVGHAPPRHTDFEQFPPLNGVRPTGFVIGRTHSFSSALQAVTAVPPVRQTQSDAGGYFASAPVSRLSSEGPIVATCSRGSSASSGSGVGVGVGVCRGSGGGTVGASCSRAGCSKSEWSTEHSAVAGLEHDEDAAEREGAKCSGRGCSSRGCSSRGCSSRGRASDSSEARGSESSTARRRRRGRSARGAPRASRHAMLTDVISAGAASPADEAADSPGEAEAQAADSSNHGEYPAVWDADILSAHEQADAAAPDYGGALSSPLAPRCGGGRAGIDAGLQPSDALEEARRQAQSYTELSRASVHGVLAWLRSLDLHEHCTAFQQQAVDGKMLATLGEEDLQRDLKVSSRMHRRRLLLELNELRKVAPPLTLAPRRDRSAPDPSFALEEVVEPLELKQLRERVEGSAAAADGGSADRIRVVKVCRVINQLLSYRFERTARQLLLPNGGRAVPPQGGYFHGTSEEATLSICEHGFDDARWKGGKYGLGQYLSAAATKTLAGKYTQGDSMLLLCEAVLGRAWQLSPGVEAPASLGIGGWAALSLQLLGEQGYDSLAVPESDEIVVYRRYQAIPRYIIYFERHAGAGLPAPERISSPFGALVSSGVPHVFADGRYEQWLGGEGCTGRVLGSSSCTRCRARDRRTNRDVFLKLVHDAERAAREQAALRAVGPAHAPALLDSFELEGQGTVLVLEAAQPGSDACLSMMCRRHARGFDEATVREGGVELLVMGFAQRVLQLVERVHQVGWVHCDLKPQHFMRFPGNELKLVDFGAAHRTASTATPAHSRRYCSPELAHAFLRVGRHAPLVLKPSLDMWAAGLVLYELFVGRPFFGEFVEYAEIATTADTVLRSRLQEFPTAVSDGQARLLACMIAQRPEDRTPAVELLHKHVFENADDTVERLRVEVVAFFSNPKKDLSLMKEIMALLEAFKESRRREVRPAAKLSDVAAVLDSNLLPRVIAFSGHQFCGYLLFEQEGPASHHLAVPSSDALISLLCPQRAPELHGLFLNACKTERLAHEVHKALPHLSIVCWRSLALDAAAKAFSRGFYEALASGTQVAITSAFEAGRASALRAGFREGDPEDYLHPSNHPHCSGDFKRRPSGEWRKCPGCNPSVHGQPVLVAGGKSRPEYQLRS